MRAAALVTSLLIGFATAEAQDKLLLAGPDDSKREDLERAARALAKRCEAYGYKDVVVKVADVAGAARIEVSCVTGLPEKVRESIVHLSAFPCGRVELRFKYLMNKREAEQYAVGKSAPKGASWLELSTWQGKWSDRSKEVVGGTLYYSAKFFVKPEGTEACLLRDTPCLNLQGRFTVLPPADAVTRTAKDGTPEYIPAREACLELSGDVTKILRSMVAKDPDGGMDVIPAVLLIDGTRFPTPGTVHWVKKTEKLEVAQWDFTELRDKESVLPLSLKNPLPFALKQVK